MIIRIYFPYSVYLPMSKNFHNITLIAHQRILSGADSLWHIEVNVDSSYSWFQIISCQKKIWVIKEYKYFLTICVISFDHKRYFVHLLLSEAHCMYCLKNMRSLSFISSNIKVSNSILRLSRYHFLVFSHAPGVLRSSRILTHHHVC